MSYTFKKIKSHPWNYGTKRSRSSIKYLVYHYTANETDTAVANGMYYSRMNPYRASAHYFVDSSTIVQSVEDNVAAHSVGGRKWNDCKKTGGGKLYKICKNSNSISIELCSVDGKLTKETVENALMLGRKLCHKYDIKRENVIRHFDVTGKHCPIYFCLTKEKDKKFEEFKDMLFSKSKAKTRYVSRKSCKCDICRFQIKLNDFMRSVKGWKQIKEDGMYGKETRDGLILFWKHLGWKVCTGWRAGEKTLKKLKI